MHKQPRAIVRGRTRTERNDMPLQQQLMIVGGAVLAILSLIALLIASAIQPVTRKAPVIRPVTDQVVIANAQPVAAPALITVSTVASAAPAAPAEAQYFERPVKKGEWLIKIATVYCNDYMDVAKRNGIANPDTIYPGQPLKLKKVTYCTPETAKLKASPVVRNTQRVAAPRDKLVVPVPANVASQAPAALDTDDCAKLVWRVKNLAQKILARTKCIEQSFGKHIRDAIAQIDPSLSFEHVVALIDVESNGSPRAWNEKTDCHSLMQLQSSTARHFGVKNMYDPRENIFGGVRVLSGYTKLFAGLNDQEMRGLVGFNVGPYSNKTKGIDRSWLYRTSYDPRRHDYVQKVMRVLDIMHSGYASSKSVGNEVLSRAVNPADEL